MSNFHACGLTMMISISTKNSDNFIKHLPIGGNIRFVLDMDAIREYSRSQFVAGTKNRITCFQDRKIENRIRTLTVLRSESV